MNKTNSLFLPKYISTSSAMLSSPVPDNFIVPARLAPFITKLVSLIKEAPCAESIGPVYQLTASLQTCPRALCEIPSEVMSNLQSELTRMLRNFEDHMGNLLCLATFARIASSQKNGAVSKHFQSTPSWLQSIQHFFGSKRGLKTLDLVFLRVILACSASCNNLTTDQALESVKLAIEICDTVEAKQKEDWIKVNSPKISKLCEKVAREDIDDRVQVLVSINLFSGPSTQYVIDFARVLHISSHLFQRRPCHLRYRDSHFSGCSHNKVDMLWRFCQQISFHA